jgi:hypothetical protein
MIAAVVSAIMNFVFLPYSPWWALILIAIDFVIIWALAQYLRQPVGIPPQATPAGAADAQAAPQDKQTAVS